MPIQRGKSSLLAKLGATGAKAFDAHKTDETKFSAGGDLPPDVIGIAQLVDCKFSQYEKGEGIKGEYFFYAAGIVKMPKVHNGIPVEGLRTSILEPLCETPGRSRETIEDHLAWILNEMRKLGIPTEELTIDDLESTAAALKEAKPHFKFRTWQGEPTTEYPKPRINHVWNGITEYEDDEDDSAGVQDDSASAEPAPKTQAKSSGGKGGGKSPPPKKTEPAPWDADDLNSVAEAADNDDEEAQINLQQLAVSLGVDYEAAENWAAVAAEIVEEQNSSTESNGEAVAPSKGDVYMYKPKGAKKAIECEVTAVFEKNQTVNLKNLDDSKAIKAVAWDALEQG